jgi:membrane protein YdbS with pleckstrin-like domain
MHLATSSDGEAVRAGPGPPTGVQIAARLPLTLTPERGLLVYYVLCSLVFGPAFLFVLAPLYFRFRTLRYELDHEGITMRWGILFRREISLTYTRIQDIHLSSNVVERWLGLAKIQIQTASGNASAELTVQGIREFEAIRDFLYSRMRGASEGSGLRSGGGAETVELPVQTLRELVLTLHEVASEVRALRAELPRAEGGSGDP